MARCARADVTTQWDGSFYRPGTGLPETFFCRNLELQF